MIQSQGTSIRPPRSYVSQLTYSRTRLPWCWRTNILLFATPDQDAIQHQTVVLRDAR